MTGTAPPHIAILGTGFAALNAARVLRKNDPYARITVIGRAPEFVYLPSLIWLPSGIRKPEDLVIPLGNFFSRNKVEFHAGEVTGLENGGRIVNTSTGNVDNDGLIIATGGRFIKKLPGIENAITPCEGIETVMRFTEKLNAMDGGTVAFGFAGNPKEQTAMRGGPMFEFLFGTEKLLRKQGRRDKFKIVFFSPAPKPGIRLGQKVVPRLMARMAKCGIETHLGHKMVRFEPDKIITEGGEVAADVILFMPGMTGNKWFDNTNLPRSPGGMIEADAQCRVDGWDKVYVAGDSGSFPGPDWLPKQAHMADIQADTAARNLIDELGGRTPSRGFKTELMCVIDNGEDGTFVARTPSLNLVLPPLRLMHFSKRWFEVLYLRRYR